MEENVESLAEAGQCWECVGVEGSWHACGSQSAHCVGVEGPRQVTQRKH